MGTTPAEQFALTSELYFELERELRSHGIEIPFPQRDLHIRTANSPSEWVASTSNGHSDGAQVSEPSQLEDFPPQAIEDVASQ